MIEQYRKQRGFTLMEVIAVTAITGTLAAFTVPMIDDYHAFKSQSAAQNAFRDSVQIAREAAVSQGQRVNMCPSADGKQCGGSWSDGWLVFIGEHNEPSSAEHILKANQLDKDVQLELISQAPSLLNTLSFDANGFSLQKGRVTVTFCDADEQLQTLTVEPTGRVVNTDSNANFEQGLLKSIHQAGLDTQISCTQA